MELCKTSFRGHSESRSNSSHVKRNTCCKFSCNVRVQTNENRGQSMLANIQKLAWDESVGKFEKEQKRQS